MKQYGLIGKTLKHSFSKKYFSDKFLKENITDAHYELYPLPEISDFLNLLKEEKNLNGLNVTIPYKEGILSYLNQIDDAAKEIGAVNTIKIEGGSLIGYNTDAYGFQKSLKPFLAPVHERALILGTGGASKAVAYVLKNIGIDYKYVSREPITNGFTYEDINEHVMAHFKLIINCTPLGTFPNIDDKPNIPYKHLTSDHYLYDLVYNPAQTSFLKEGKEKGCITQNGLDMLIGQAEKAWEIWNN